MKKSILFLLSVAFLTTTFTSCTDEDNVIDSVFDGVQNGAVLRTISIPSGELPIGLEDANFSVEVEAQDIENGALLSSVDVFVAFNDNTEENGDSSKDEVAVRTIDKGAFTTGDQGLPRTTITVTLAEMLSLLNLTEDDLFGGDIFAVRLALNLTDGRTFSSDNAGGIITGGFFSSPFAYNPTVVCPVEETSFVGEYLIEEITPYVDGPTFDDGSVVTVEVGDFSTERVFFTANYPDYCSTPNAFRFALVCGTVEVPFQNSNCVCNSGADFFGPAEVPSTYDFTDDSVFLLTFSNDTQTDCGPPVDTTYRFTKQ